MSYAKVLFIGYTLHTAPKSAVFQGEQLELEAGSYPGLAHPDQDQRARCALVKTAMTAAHAALDKATLEDRGLLKLLVLPEFFFHARGQAYAMDSPSSGLACLQEQLARLLRARKWQDWLCVFGTALFCRMDPSGPLIFNCALVHRGGPDAGPPQLVQVPLSEAEQLVPTQLPAAKGDPHWADSERPVWDQTGRLALDGIDLALELSCSHRHRARRSRLAPPLPGARTTQLLIRPACAPLREAGGTSPVPLSFLCNGLVQGECLLQAGEETLRPQNTLPLKTADHEIPAMFAGRSAGRLSFFAPQPLPQAELAEHFIAHFSHTTKYGHILDFTMPYGRDGRLQRVEVQARLPDTNASTSGCLPCTLELRHPLYPLVARLALRYGPEDDQGRDLLVFAEIEGDAKGTLHSFASRIPAVAAPQPELAADDLAAPITRAPPTATAEPPRAAPEPDTAPAPPPTATPASPQPVGRAALVAAGPNRNVGKKTKEKTMSNIIEIEGIGPAIGGILEKHGVATVEDLLKRAADPKGRTELAQQTGLPYKLVLRWCNMADLFRIKGVAEEYSDLLEAAGVDTVPELAQRNAANLHERMSEINERRKLVRRLPTAKQVAAWVEQAQQLPRLMTY